MALKDNVKKFRKENKMTQEELAKKIGVSRTYIQMIEKGEKENIGIKYAAPMAKTFNISIERLID